MKNRLLIIITTSIMLFGCGGVENNIVISTAQGECANNTNNSPYCMSVTVKNNPDGQNFINSHNFSIKNLTIQTIGADNISTPATDATTMDPNQCTSKTIVPGSQCTFYIKINKESNPVSEAQPVTLKLNYTINNQLFGDSTNNQSSEITIYQITNLYTVTNQGYLWYYNKATSGNKLILTNDKVNSIAVDNSNSGKLFLAGNLGIYNYGNEDTSTSISQAPLTGANNLLSNNSGKLFASGLTGATGIWALALTSLKWSNEAIYTYSNPFAANINTLSSSGTVYIVPQHDQQNSIVACSSNTNNSCLPEGPVLPNDVEILSLGFANMSPPYTGLFVGTNNGLFAESGTTPTNGNSNLASWEQVPLSSTSNILAMASDNNGNLYAGDNSGNIWKITKTNMNNNDNSSSLSPFIHISTNSSIVGITIDNFGKMLYFVAGNVASGGTYSLYSCNLTTSCTEQQQIFDNSITGTIAGITIGSQLVDQNPVK